MLKAMKRRQARFVALLAKAARDERGALLGNISEKDLGEPKPGRGEHNPTEAFGFEPLPSDSPQLSALRDAIANLPFSAQLELYGLMRMGQGQYTAKDWDRELSEAELLGYDTVRSSLTDDVDLYDHVEKGLYEMHLAA